MMELKVGLKVAQKVRIICLLLAIIHDEKNLLFYSLEFTRLQKVEYLLNGNSDPYEILNFSS